MRENASHWQLSLKYSKTEFFAVILNIVGSSSVIIFTIFASIPLEFNRYRLIYIFYIIWLPFDGISINWFVNYIYQALVLAFAGTFYLMYFPLILIVVNHCCLGLDILLLDIETLGKIIDSQTDENIIQSTNELSVSNNKMFANQLKLIVKTHYDVLKWKNDVRTFMQFTFLADFTLLSLILCMCIYNVIINTSESGIAVVAMILLMWQLFIECWMGNRVIVRIEKLSSVIYGLNWHLIGVEQQKDLQIILIITQNMKGFDGIFKSVSMETFQKVRLH